MTISLILKFNRASLGQVPIVWSLLYAITWTKFTWNYTHDLRLSELKVAQPPSGFIKIWETQSRLKSSFYPRNTTIHHRIPTQFFKVTRSSLLNHLFPFALYALKISENSEVFCFQGVEKGYTWNKWVNLTQSITGKHSRDQTTASSLRFQEPSFLVVPN